MIRFLISLYDKLIDRNIFCRFFAHPIQHVVELFLHVRIKLAL
ncbi:hypothetical protein YSA_03621 [Pseudomonas putida ND6]|uniref:Uncharacterized protein n=1 Tax=Pseudomonas putida ND6 TaxID=231023 RepID=I3UTA1_PSEPU|nr:hypothetical protein YSA_03621 [Pseudomonas putida ND6]